MAMEIGEKLGMTIETLVVWDILKKKQSVHVLKHGKLLGWTLDLVD